MSSLEKLSERQVFAFLKNKGKCKNLIPYDAMSCIGYRTVSNQCGFSTGVPHSPFYIPWKSALACSQLQDRCQRHTKGRCTFIQQQCHLYETQCSGRFIIVSEFNRTVLPTIRMCWFNTSGRHWDLRELL